MGSMIPYYNFCRVRLTSSPESAGKTRPRASRATARERFSEPGTFLLMGLGLAGLLAARRKGAV